MNVAVDVPPATAILDRFLHHAEVVTIRGKSCRLKSQAKKQPPGEKTPSERGDKTCDEKSQ